LVFGKKIALDNRGGKWLKLLGSDSERKKYLCEKPWEINKVIGKK
jgi:hypothetical protein